LKASIARQPMEQDYKEAKKMALMFHPTSGNLLTDLICKLQIFLRMIF